jgi:DnaJ-domain-containing protein 1
MGIFDRLGNLIKSYLNDDESGGRRSTGDPDLDTAADELDEFLSGGRGKSRTEWDAAFHAGQEDSAGQRSAGRGQESGGSARPAPVPPELRADFAELGLPLGAPLEDCKKAYKDLLKIHHPDRHSGHPENMRKATTKSARLNAAYDRLEQWYQAGRL